MGVWLSSTRRRCAGALYPSCASGSWYSNFVDNFFLYLFFDHGQKFNGRQIAVTVLCVQQRREQLSRRLKDTQPDNVDTKVGMQGHGENRSSSIGRKVGQCQRNVDCP